jgi:PadR family transcriptional regulator, regulatory protein PadR
MRAPSERFEASLTKDNLWIYILTLLRKKELYAYEINEKIRKEFGFSPGNVTAYIVIQRLKSGGYIKSSRKGKEGGPVRHYYTITRKGDEELKKVARISKRYLGKL